MPKPWIGISAYDFCKANIREDKLSPSQLAGFLAPRREFFQS